MKWLNKTTRKPEVDDIIKELKLDDATYRKIGDLLNADMDKGLSKDGNAKSDLKMFITYVQSLPDGTETGSYLALDLGGTNFRVLRITLKGSTVHMENKIYPIAEELMLGEGEKLFDYIAACIESFMKDHHIANDSLPLGFTFSFPCKQEGLAVGRLVRWTKGFKCPGVEGNDVVKMLDDAIKRRPNLDVDCVALLNDTVGCLMSCAFHDHDTKIGVILGTGTNACYVEKLDRVQLWDGPADSQQQVIINTEWGAFGDSGSLDFVRTRFDNKIDAESLNPGKQIYEKMISGMYMGEIARLVIVECAEKKLLFGGQLSEELKTPARFYTKYLSEIEKDSEKSEFPHSKQILDELNITDVSVEDCRSVYHICAAVSSRAAYLAAAGIAVLINRINKNKITVAVDGSLFRFHPHFPRLMREKITALIKPGIEFKLMLSEDGSGKGAALVAAVAHRLKKSNK